MHTRVDKRYLSMSLNYRAVDIVLYVLTRNIQIISIVYLFINDKIYLLIESIVDKYLQKQGVHVLLELICFGLLSTNRTAICSLAISRICRHASQTSVV